MFTNTNIQYISTLFSGFIGSIVGGIVTCLVTKNSLKKQLGNQNNSVILEQKKQEKLAKLEQKKQGKIALKSVKSEIDFNSHHFIEIKRYMMLQKTDFVDFKERNLDNMLRMDKWEKHSDAIENIEKLDYILALQSFYYSISAEIFNQMGNSKRIDSLIKNAVKLSKLLEDTIKTYEKSNEDTQISQ